MKRFSKAKEVVLEHISQTSSFESTHCMHLAAAHATMTNPALTPEVWIPYTYKA